MTRKRLSAGLYRIKHRDAGAIIHRERGEWIGSIYSHGKLLRHAGIWGTLRDATEEAKRLLARV